MKLIYPKEFKFYNSPRILTNKDEVVFESSGTMYTGYEFTTGGIIATPTQSETHYLTRADLEVWVEQNFKGST